MIKKIIKDFKLTAGEHRDIPCTLPCSLVSVFQENGIIPPIHIADNIERVLSLPDECELSAVVSIGSDIISEGRVYVKLDGVCANSELIFNGKSYGFMKNPDREFVFELTDGVREGDNTLLIRASAPSGELFYADSDKPSSARIADMGIVGSCIIYASSHPIIYSIRVTQKHERDKVTLGIKLDTLGGTPDMRSVATLVSPVGRLYFAGITGGEGTLIVPSPECWMPNGYGTQSLYKLTVTVYEAEEAVDSADISVGIRSLSVEDGALTVCGTRISLKGASYVRDDVSVPMPKQSRAKRAVDALVGAHMNMLHILDSGAHPDEYLYSLCDKYGIIIVQQIALTYEPQSSIAGYLSTLKNELPRMLGILAGHPSVCAVSFVPVYDKWRALPMGDGVLNEFLACAARVIDPIMAEYASSFLYPSVTNPESSIVRIVSHAALPAMRTLEEFIPECDRNLLSPVMEAHADTPDDAPQMLAALCERFRYADSFSSLVYSSQLSSALAMKEQAEAARSADASVSLMFSELNDSRPVLSSSLVDSSGRYKAAYYLSKKFLSPVSVISSAEESSMIFKVSNETDLLFSGTLNFALYDDGDDCIIEGKRPIMCEGSSSLEAVREDLSQYMPLGREHYYVVYDVYDGKTTSDKETLLFTAPKRFAFRNPEIVAEIKGVGTEFEIVLASRAFAMGVYVDFTDTEAEFSKNFVDVHRDFPVKLSFNTSAVTTAEHLRSTVRITSVYDIAKK